MISKNEWYQVVENYGNQMHAGSKATNDVSDILSGMEFNKLYTENSPRQKNPFKKVLRQSDYARQWKKLPRDIKDGSILILQHPFHIKQLGRKKSLSKLKKEKHVKIISIVHDVEELRGLFKLDYYNVEFRDMVSLADAIIVHNYSMMNWFIEKGVNKDKLITLEIFDYLNSKVLKLNHDLSKHVVIAGNLSKSKSPYIYKLPELSNLEFKLFGINYDETEIAENVSYEGAFPADEVPMELNSGFGLVWDGDSLETCSGNTGNYLRYNNPHKLSLYLSSGLPVIVWSESAESEFVEKNKVGFSVSSLEEISTIFEALSEEQLIEFKKNAIEIGNKLKQGHYLSTAVKEAINRINF